MAKRPSSGRWLDEHRNDPYVQEAARLGYRSRAAFKLIEINQRDRLMRPGQRVLDLGAAPGGWSQVAIQQVGAKGRVIATDILDMETVAGVDFIRGDFTEQATLEAILALNAHEPVDLVLSDLAPNMSGTRAVDQARAMALAELAADCARQVLKTNGAFVCKVFMGEGFDEFVRVLRVDYQKLATRKPDASRDRSREVYLVASGWRGSVELA